MSKEEMKFKFIEDLLKERIIYLEGEINFNMVNKLEKMLLWLIAQDKNKEITTYLNSPGGFISSGLDMYNLFKHFIGKGTPITTIVTQRANSIAVVALQAASARKAIKSTTFYLHNSVLTVEKEWDEFEEKAKKELEGIKKAQEEVWRILSQRTIVDIEKIKQLHKEKKTISAEEAKEYGLIDEII